MTVRTSVLAVDVRDLRGDNGRVEESLRSSGSAGNFDILDPSPNTPYLQHEDHARSRSLRARLAFAEL